MKAKMLTCLFVLGICLVMAQFAQAGTLTFSGRDWTTRDGTGATGGNVGDGRGDPSYTSTATSGTALGAYGNQSGMWTALSVSPGDVITFDQFVTADTALDYLYNPGLMWLGDVSVRLIGNTVDIEYWNTETVLFMDSYWSPGTLNPTVLDLSYEFVFVSETAVEVTKTDHNNAANNATWTAAISAGISAIDGFYSVMWDSAQHNTISNFVHRKATAPTPAAAVDLVPIDQVFSWAPPDDPNIVSILGYDVYFDPNLADVTARDASVQVGVNQAENTYTPAASLEFGITYYWRVDLYVDYDYIAGVDANSTIDGYVWSFTTESATPAITIFDNILTSMDLLPATVSAVVQDGDNDVASVLWEVLDDDQNYPAGAIAAVPDATTDLYNPTAAFTTDTSGIYMVLLTVTDGQGNVDSKVAQVRVEQTGCDQAKLNLEGVWVANYYDRDQDCDVDLRDFAVFAAEWLDDTSIGAEQTWEGAVAYVPMVNGMPNGSFETGDSAGWTYNWGEITDEPADVYDGSYSYSFDDTGGVTGYVGLGDLPVGDHSITFQYKGDLTELRCLIVPGTATPEITNLALSTLTPDPGDYTIVSGPVPSYTQYTIEFTVTEAGTATFYVWGIYDGIGTGYVDDFRLNLN